MSKKQTSYVFVTGGVLSGIGKGITAASLGALFNCAGLKVSMQKLEPYLSVDSGMLSPAEHGECFVTADGKETDLDLGHYERFTGVNTNKNTLTISGVLYQELFKREREGKYLGKTIMVIPQLTGLVQEKIIEQGKDSDIHIVEIGGTVGDFESVALIEAVSQMASRIGWSNFLFVHVGYVPFLGVSQEFKTKPLQNSVRDLRDFGIIPKIVIARTEVVPQNNYIEKKSAPYLGIPEEQVVVLPNADTIYRVPITLHEKGIGKYILDRFGFKNKKVDISRWKKVVNLLEKSKQAERQVKIGVVAKYLDNADSYYSVIESLKIAAWHSGVNLKYDWVSAEELEKKGAEKILKNYDGILVPGGFGNRGIEGKIKAAQYALENKVPYLGLCLGLQVAVIGASRLGGLKNANSEEFKKNDENVVYIMEDQKGKEETGGTMRLGTYKCHILKGTKALKVFGKKEIEERHRHRFEVNRKFENFFSKGGVKVSGTSKDGKLVELVEAVDPKHPFFLATQSHPEFLSRPWSPHPLFLEFIKACKK
jgi:CTP synthase